MEWEIVDKELGVITLRRSARATRYTLKIANGRIEGVMPLRGDEKRMLDFIDEKRKLLSKELQKRPARAPLDESTVLQTNTFRLHIFCTERKNFYMKLELGVLHIACPFQTDFMQEHVQKILQDLLRRALLHEAKRILPQRLHNLAVQYKFTYTGVRISKSKTSWGSCNARKGINLSCSLMLLPDHLIDYVLLHELCHTEEMSHNERFWRLMDSVTDNKAKALREELKQYHTL